MSGSNQQKDQNPLSTAAPTVPSMLGSRVRKRRAPGAYDAPAKRAKIAAPSAPPKAQTSSHTVKFAQPLKSAAASSAPASKSSSTAQSKAKKTAKSPRQLRLTEMLKREHMQRFKDTAPEPTIILGAPHMDSRRPKPRSSPSPVTSSSPSTSSAPSTPRKRTRAKSDVDTKLISLLSSPVTRHPITPESSQDALPQKETVSSKEETKESFVSTASLASTRVRCSGTEAITYSRSMLPKAHGLMLDIFAGIETAVNLLRTRQEPTTFGSVRNIVAQSSKRQFTFRHLSQLAHLVPEALCVLPAKNSRQKSREHLVLRLDDVKLNSTGSTPSKTSMMSFVGGAATRARRQLLHNRLLEHVGGHHKKFLAAQGIKKFESNIWHENFDLEKDVPELGAPPLYPVAPPRLEKPKATKDEDKKDAERSEAAKKSESKEDKPKTVILGSTEQKDTKAEVDSCIPSSLLARVRARSRARAELTSAKDVDYRSRPDYIARLPATMDTIASILRNERRQAMGWKNLVERVVKDHPRQWSADEVERQMESIVDMASGWCTKIALTGPKLRYAFRMVDERKFAAQRAKVVAAQNQT